MTGSILVLTILAVVVTWRVFVAKALVTTGTTFVVKTLTTTEVTLDTTEEIGFGVVSFVVVT